MAKLPVREYPDPVLKQKAQPVTVFGDELKKLAQDMAETMYANDGVGLAAPQVGLSLRFITLDVAAGEDRGKEFLALANPVVVQGEGVLPWEEGCLSLPGMTVKTRRKAHVIVEAQDLNGNRIVLEGDELMAVALQHEIDHLDGVLLLDHASPLKKRMLLRDYARDKKRSMEE